MSIELYEYGRARFREMLLAGVEYDIACEFRSKIIPPAVVKISRGYTCRDCGTYSRDKFVICKDKYHETQCFTCFKVKRKAWRLSRKAA